MGKLFGTDGVRGIAHADLTEELAASVGYAAAQVLASEHRKKPVVLIGRDTRESGEALETAVARGLCTAGADVVLCGVVPTPAIAFLVTERKADAGVMISASHNPYEYNGIKLFGPSGCKLRDEEEDQIEALILGGKADPAGKAQTGTVTRDDAAVSDYVAHLAEGFSGTFTGKVLVDCANGSASATAEKLFDALGVQADLVNCAPDGKNINDGCGSTHIEELIPRVREGGYDVAFAFDGDADRLLVVDEAGHILDGDFLLAILADYLKQHNRLKNDTVVVTTMSNLGFFKLMEERSVRTAVTKVGDRYVLEEMLKNGHVLGGEQSGHMILLDRATTGDGQLSAVTLLEAMMDAGKPLSVLGGAMKRFPQVMVNVPATVSMKAQLDENDAVRRVIADCEAGFGSRGRVVVRASGTEPLIRVMVEGEDDQMIAHAADRIAQTIRNELI